MMPPLSAADPRPGGKPYYIEPNCPTCGTALVLLDSLEKSKDGVIWYDEWVCPNYPEDSELFMDWPSDKVVHADWD